MPSGDRKYAHTLSQCAEEQRGQGCPFLSVSVLMFVGHIRCQGGYLQTGLALLASPDVRTVEDSLLRNETDLSLRGNMTPKSEGHR